jgi:hypothetical protein
MKKRSVRTQDGGRQTDGELQADFLKTGKLISIHPRRAPRRRGHAKERRQGIGLEWAQDNTM